MHWNDRAELEVFLAGHRRLFRAHREAVTDRNAADFRFVLLLHERHVAKNFRIAHVIERLALGPHDEPAGHAEIDRLAVHCRR
jgi:hypothetical protein